MELIIEYTNNELRCILVTQVRVSKDKLIYQFEQGRNITRIEEDMELIRYIYLNGKDINGYKKKKL